MLRPAMSGAEPWVACAIACRSPTHRPGAKPSPPTSPTPISVRMSPNWLVVTTTSNCCGAVTSFIEIESIHHLLERHVRILARDLAAFLGEHAAGEPIDRLLVRGRDLLAFTGAGDLEGFARDAVRSFARDHAHGDRDVVVGPELRQPGDDRFGIEHSLGELAQEPDVHVHVDRWNRGRARAQGAPPRTGRTSCAPAASPRSYRRADRRRARSVPSPSRRARVASARSPPEGYCCAARARACRSAALASRCRAARARRLPSSP